MIEAAREKIRGVKVESNRQKIEKILKKQLKKENKNGIVFMTRYVLGVLNYYRVIKSLVRLYGCG